MANFSELLASKQTRLAATQAAPVTLSLNDGTLVASDEESFQKSDKYLWYENYHDDDYSTIDDKRIIKLSKKQINIHQEENSQVIPFIMNRFYDGIDLMDMIITVYFVNQNNGTGESVAINVEYSETKIKFYWLVDGTATFVPGTLKIEIRAIGKNEKNNRYVWKTQTNREITILESLSGDNIVLPDVNYDSYIELFDNRIDHAQTTADDALTLATENAKDIDVLEETTGEDCSCETISAESVYALFDLNDTKGGNDYVHDIGET